MHTYTSFILLWLAIFSWHVSADCSCNLKTSTTGCQLYDPFFNGCCSRLQLQQDSSGRKAFTGFCPVPADVQTRYPYNTHLFSKLYLDECLAFNDTGKPHWITWNDKKNGVPDMFNFTQVCPSDKDVIGFLVGKDYVLGGKCKGGQWTLPGTSFIQQVWTQNGALGCGYYDKNLVVGNGKPAIVTLGTPSTGAFSQTCNNVVLSERNIKLGANCSTTPLEWRAMSWAWSALNLGDCLARDPTVVENDAKRNTLLDQINQCGLQQVGPGAQVRLECGNTNITWALNDFVRNQGGTLACYDVIGQTLPAPAYPPNQGRRSVSARYRGKTTWSTSKHGLGQR